MRKYSEVEYDKVMRLRANRLSYAEIERRSGVPRDTFRNWFSKGNKPWSVRTAEENYGSYNRKLSEETINKICVSHIGSKNHMWKGNEATEGTIRWRLQRSMPVPKSYDRHHIDGNGRNSDSSNILILTRREHMIEDCRMFSRDNKGRFKRRV